MRECLLLNHLTIYTAVVLYAVETKKKDLLIKDTSLLGSAPY